MPKKIRTVGFSTRPFKNEGAVGGMTGRQRGTGARRNNHRRTFACRVVAVKYNGRSENMLLPCVADISLR